MSSARWAEVKEVFHGALAVEGPDERRAYVARACAGDDELRSEVDSLLASYEGAGDFLQRDESAIGDGERAIGDGERAIGGGEHAAARRARGANPRATNAAHTTAETIGVPSPAAGAAPGARACPRCGARFGSRDIVCPHDGEVLLDDPAAVVGATLDGLYRVERLLGEGGFGTVYLAHHVLLRDRVAVKILRRHLASDPELLRRFLREGRLARSIRHPNVVATHDLRVSPEGFAYMVLEYVEGRTLRQLLDDEGALAPERAVALLAPLARALDDAHAAGVVHRDLKPENVVVGEGPHGEETVKLLDMGLAKLREITSEGAAPAASAALTMPGQRMGTPAYMSPEQWGEPQRDGAAEVDGRSDVYALGLMAYEMVAGRPPFGGSSMWELRRAHVEAAPPRADEVADVPAAFARAVDRALAKDRGDRYATAGALVAALEASLGEVPGDSSGAERLAASPFAPESPAPESAAFEPRAHGSKPEGGSVRASRGSLATAPASSPIDAADETESDAATPRGRRRAVGAVAGVAALLALVGGPTALRAARTAAEPGPLSMSAAEPGSLAAPGAARGDSAADTAAEAGAAKPYRAMTDAERLAFVDARAREISERLAGHAYRIPPSVRAEIVRRVDGYAERVGNGERRHFQHEDLRFVFARARERAPLLREAFARYDVSPLIALYLPMIESEFNEDATSSMGAKGMFQMLPQTAARYGATVEDLEDPARAAPLAARYVAEQRAQFASDRMSVALSVVAYNQGPAGISRYLDDVAVLDDDEAETRFWGMLATRDPRYRSTDEGEAYVTNFFAAAIVGETPRAFGLDAEPLTSVGP